MPRKRHVSRNSKLAEIKLNTIVMPRKRHVSRNWMFGIHAAFENVMPRKRHVSRNPFKIAAASKEEYVMPRKRHVSRNNRPGNSKNSIQSCLARGM